MEFPADPITGLREGAVSLHECFLSYIAAGFTETQAMYLVGVVLATALNQGTGPAPERGNL